MNPIRFYKRLRREAVDASRIAKEPVPTKYHFGLGPAINCFTQTTIAPDTGETVKSHILSITPLVLTLVRAETVFTHDGVPQRFVLRQEKRGLRLYLGRIVLMAYYFKPTGKPKVSP